MKLNEYKGLMGDINMTPRLKEKIMRSAAVGREPRPLGERRSHPRLAKVLSVAAVLATLAVVVTAFVLIVRFVGPQSDAPIGGQTFEEDGFRLISISTGCEFVTAEVAYYNPDQRAVNIKWSFEDGYEGWTIEHEPQIFFKKQDDRWIVLSEPESGTLHTLAATYRRINGSSTFGFAGYSQSTGHFLLEKSFVVKKTDTDGTAELDGIAFDVAEHVGEYMLKIEFELTKLPDHDEEFKLLSISTGHAEVTADIAAYDEYNRRIKVKWNCPDDTPVRIYTDKFQLEKYADGAWSAMSAYPDDPDGLVFQQEYTNGYTESFDLDCNYKDIAPGRYRLTRQYGWNSQPGVLTIEFSLIDPISEEFRVISISTDREGVSAELVEYQQKGFTLLWTMPEGETVTFCENSFDLFRLTDGEPVELQKLISFNGGYFPRRECRNGEAAFYRLSELYSFNELKPGKYRLVQKLTFESDTENRLTMEFELGEPNDPEEYLKNEFELVSVSTSCNHVDVDLVGYADGVAKLLWTTETSEKLSIDNSPSMFYRDTGHGWRLLNSTDFGCIIMHEQYESGTVLDYELGSFCQEGRYKLERSFEFGGGNYTMTMIFELKKPTDDNSRAFDVISVDSGHTAVTIEKIGYDPDQKRVNVSWHVGDVKMTHVANYLIEKMYNGNWVCGADVDFIHKKYERQNESWDESYSISLFTSSVTNDRYRLTTNYSIDGVGYTMTVIFELGGGPAKLTCEHQLDSELSFDKYGHWLSCAEGCYNQSEEHQRSADGRCLKCGYVYENAEDTGDVIPQVTTGFN